MAATSAAPSVKFSFPTISPYVVRCDRKLALSAEIEGSPCPRVKWYLNRTQLAEDEQEYRLNSDGSGARHTLTVPKVRDQLNNKRLAVVVSNDHGVSSCTVDLLTYRVRRKYKPKKQTTLTTNNTQPCKSTETPHAFVRGSASFARAPVRKRPHNERIALVKRQTEVVERAKVVTRSQLQKAPRYNEPTKTTNVAILRQSTEVTGDIIVHKVPPNESEPPPPPTKSAEAFATNEQNNLKQIKAPVKSDEHSQTTYSKFVQALESEQSNPENKTVDQEPKGADTTTDTVNSPTFSTAQQTALHSLSQKSPRKPVKPARSKRKQKTTSVSMKTAHAEEQQSTEAKVTPFKQISSQRISTNSEKDGRKQTPVKSTLGSTRKITGDIFAVKVKADVVKASPVKVQYKPRRQTRATLAYDRVMFFSDFFRRLESDRRMFALPPIRRNHVYVRPRAEETVNGKSVAEQNVTNICSGTN